MTTASPPAASAQPILHLSSAPAGKLERPRRSLRVAIVCANASFRMGGEAAIPLRFFKYLRSLGHRPLLLTHERVREELHGTVSAEELAEFIFFPDTALQQRLARWAEGLPSAITESFVFPLIHLITEAAQRRTLRALAEAGKVDIAFMPTPISPKAISLIDKVGVPTVFGPLNGAMNYPPAFRPRSGRFAEALITLGRALAEPLHLLFPAKRHAAALLVSNERTIKGLPRAASTGAILRSFDATIEADRWRHVAHDTAGQPTHFLCVGRLVDWKAFEYCVLAAQKVAGASLIVVGDGPERQKLEALAAQGSAEVRFMGHLRHDQLLEIYPQVIAQILPSLREAGGNVCLEALAAGVPVIATKWGGAIDVVADGIDGILVEPGSEEELIDGIAQAMRVLMANTALARAMGRAGRARVLDAFDWRQKALDVAGVFEACLNGIPQGVAEAHPTHALDGSGLHRNLAWRGCQPVPSAIAFDTPSLASVRAGRSTTKPEVRETAQEAQPH